MSEPTVEALTAELKRVRDQWQRELICAKAELLAVQEELLATKEKLHAALLRSMLSDDEVFHVKEDAAKALQAGLAQRG